MNLEDLTKTQLLLLTILVNFVAAIATSVLTVSLLNQAPTTVTQTVNRIVENTIEQVTTQVPVGVPTASVPSTEELLTSAVVAENARNVTFHKGATNSPILAYGVYLPASKAVVTLAQAKLPREVNIQFSNGVMYPASLSKTGATFAVYGFSDAAELPSARAANPQGLSQLRQGQTAITLKDGITIGTGLITRIDQNTFVTDMTQSLSGIGVTSLSGDLIGIGSYTPGIFYSIDEITTLLSTTP